MQPFDDAMQYVGAMLVRRGERVHFDFRSVYPPFNYQPTAWAFALLGETATAARTCSLVLYVAVLGAVGSFFRRRGACGTRFFLMMAGAVILSSLLPAMPSFNGVALALLSLSVYVVASTEARSRRMWLVAASGGFAGLALVARVNFGLYVIATVVTDQVVATVCARGGSRPFRAVATELAIFFAPVAIAIAGLLIVVRGDLGEVIDQVVFAPSRALLDYSRPFALEVGEIVPLSLKGLVLPLLPFLWLATKASSARGRLLWLGAAAATALLELAVGAVRPEVLPLLVAPAACAVIVTQIRTGVLSRDEFLALIACAFFSHYQLSRPDWAHVPPSAAPAMFLFPAILGADERVRWTAAIGWARAFVCATLAWPTVLTTLRSPNHLGNAVALLRSGPYGGSDAERIAKAVLPLTGPLAVLYPNDDENRAAQFIRAHTTEADAVYVGLTDHRRPYANNIRLSWTSGRRVGARHYMLMSGFVDSHEAQEEILGDLRARRVRWVARWAARQPPESFVVKRYVRPPGSPLLDQYFERSCRAAERFGSFETCLLP